MSAKVSTNGMPASLPDEPAFVSGSGQLGSSFQQLLDAMPIAAYTCDPAGLITYYNLQAVELWGRAPSLGDPADRFCGSFKLYSPDGFLIPHDQCWMALALRMNQQFHGQEIVIERPDGDFATVLAHANPFRDDQGNCLGAVNVLVDITELKLAETAIQKLNESLEQQVAYRNEKAIAQATAKQQRHIARELHDSVLQELTGIGMMAETLRQDLSAAGSPQGKAALRIVEHLQAAHQQVRRISRGLVPVDVDADGLMVALAELADSSEQMYGMECSFTCVAQFVVDDNDTATHIYRIVQEAVQNAVKHGHPTRIEIILDDPSGVPTLTIRDDGAGFRPDSISPRGTGQRIMRYRADLIGARIHIDSTVGEGTCIMLELNAGD